MINILTHIFDFDT